MWFRVKGGLKPVGVYVNEDDHSSRAGATFSYFSLCSRGKRGVGDSTVDGQIWVTLHENWLVDSTKPEMCGAVCFGEAFENLRLK